MKYRQIIINIPLTDEAADTFDVASYEYDSYFLDELAEMLQSILQAQLTGHYPTHMSVIVEDLANDVANALNLAEEERY